MKRVVKQSESKCQYALTSKGAISASSSSVGSTLEHCNRCGPICIDDSMLSAAGWTGGTHATASASIIQKLQTLQYAMAKLIPRTIGVPRADAHKFDRMVAIKRTELSAFKNALLQSLELRAGPSTQVYRHRAQHLLSDNMRVQRRQHSSCDSSLARPARLMNGQTPSVMTWGAIGYNMRSRPLHIEENLNSNSYSREVLEPKVLPLLQATPHAIFQQDNARPHVARKLIDEKFSDMQVLVRWCSVLLKNKIMGMFPHIGATCVLPHYINNRSLKLPMPSSDALCSVILLTKIMLHSGFTTVKLYQTINILEDSNVDGKGTIVAVEIQLQSPVSGTAPDQETCSNWNTDSLPHFAALIQCTHQGLVKLKGDKEALKRQYMHQLEVTAICLKSERSHCVKASVNTDLEEFSRYTLAEQIAIAELIAEQIVNVMRIAIAEFTAGPHITRTQTTLATPMSGESIVQYFPAKFKEKRCFLGHNVHCLTVHLDFPAMLLLQKNTARVHWPIDSNVLEVAGCLLVVLLRHRVPVGNGRLNCTLCGCAVPQWRCRYVLTDTYTPSLRGTHLRCRVDFARTLGTRTLAGSIYLCPSRCVAGRYEHVAWLHKGVAVSLFLYATHFLLTTSMTKYKGLQAASSFLSVTCRSLGHILRVAETRTTCVRLTRWIQNFPPGGNLYEPNAKPLAILAIPTYHPKDHQNWDQHTPETLFTLSTDKTKQLGPLKMNFYLSTSITTLATGNGKKSQQMPLPGDARRESGSPYASSSAHGIRGEENAQGYTPNGPITSPKVDEFVLLEASYNLFSCLHTSPGRHQGGEVNTNTLPQRRSVRHSSTIPTKLRCRGHCTKAHTAITCRENIAVCSADVGARPATCIAGRAPTSFAACWCCLALNPFGRGSCQAVGNYTIILPGQRPTAGHHCHRYRSGSLSNSGPVLGKHDMHHGRGSHKSIRGPATLKCQQPGTVEQNGRCMPVSITCLVERNMLLTFPTHTPSCLKPNTVDSTMTVNDYGKAELVHESGAEVERAGTYGNEVMDEGVELWHTDNKSALHTATSSATKLLHTISPYMLPLLKLQFFMENFCGARVWSYGIQIAKVCFTRVILESEVVYEGREADVTRLLRNRPPPPEEGKQRRAKRTACHSCYTVQCVRHTAGCFSVWETVFNVGNKFRPPFPVLQKKILGLFHTHTKPDTDISAAHFWLNHSSITLSSTAYIDSFIIFLFANPLVEPTLLANSINKIDTDCGKAIRGRNAAVALGSSYTWQAAARLASCAVSSARCLATGGGETPQTTIVCSTIPFHQNTQEGGCEFVRALVLERGSMFHGPREKNVKVNTDHFQGWLNVKSVHYSESHRANSADTVKVKLMGLNDKNSWTKTATGINKHGLESPGQSKADKVHLKLMNCLWWTSVSSYTQYLTMRKGMSKNPGSLEP
ncbi:hypothetical protein PR048_030147 [Dryococelus australis]|uniref:Uncharacterized protein n=1 Tax=Dryococelus australis TaxID=614101 RepID=A0ABQ9G844_9NEOP|nr:hypothetical protein PR048_030147 [Dryococelus australis]